MRVKLTRCDEQGNAAALGLDETVDAETVSRAVRDACEAAQRAAQDRDRAEVGATFGGTPARPNHWTERQAGADVEGPRCVHGRPRNVFCGRCES